MTPTESDIEAMFEELPPERAMRELLPLAQDGHPVAQFYVGELYGLGDGVQRSETSALEWYLRSAKSGYARAHHYVAVCYETGVGCNIDRDLASKHFQLASDLGFKLAQGPDEI